jgi:signal transduction histidine kinase/DNA-binding NarL/FixJ family response regulator
VFFLLALGFLSLRALAFEPLAVEVPLPAALRGKPVWVVEPLAAGRLAVGFEGGLAIGSPSGDWQLAASPNGQVVRAISEAHGRLLVAGHGFAAFLEDEHLQAITGLELEILKVEPIPEGWLVAGGGGVWQITSAGKPTRLLSPPTDAKSPFRLCRIGADLIVSAIGITPMKWSRDGLVTAPRYSDYDGQEIDDVSDGLRITSQGVRDQNNRAVLPPGINEILLKAGIVGLAETGPWILVPTFSKGVFALDRGSGAVAWTTHKFGDIYHARRMAGNFLFGTANGLFSVSDPARVDFTGLDGKAVLGLQAAETGMVHVVTSAGTQSLGRDEAPQASQLWPAEHGAGARNPDFIFGEHRVRLQSRFINGLAVAGDTAAIAQDQGLTLLDRTGVSRFTAIPAIAGSLATDGRNFLVGTATRGVQVVAPDGRVASQLGTGRAAVRTVRPGKVALLFWDGAILDSDASTLGRIAWGNPRDAAFVQGRLAVLVTRPDRDPVVGLLEGSVWQPLDIPGLAEIGAEKIAATDGFLYAAGPRGVIRARLPLIHSAAPRPGWVWSAPVTDGRVHLPNSAQERVAVRARAFDLAPAPATFLRLRKQGGAWEALRPGADFSLPVGWGATAVTLQAERNGLLTETAFTVVRPWPWWLRSWAWPLHVLALGCVVFGLVRWRTRTLHRRNLELEAHVSERTAQLRKASAVKEEFLASISHEIRNPLNGVVGICAMLADRNVGPREQVLVRTLGGCADQLRSMLDDILDFSRLERGQSALTNVDFETGALVEEAARAMDPELTACALMLPEQTAWLHGDSGKLRQIVCNLISNALKYGVPREAGVEVRLAPAGGGRSRLRLAVRNSGATIPAGELNRLFDSFQRGAHTGNIPGSGLGLAVCRRLAQAMGGRITAASLDGVTEFALELTLANAQPPAPAAGLPIPISRALAIEDEDYNRIALGHVLQQLGYDVHWAADGAGALKLAATNPYDLVLTDWRLPDTDGGTLCRQLLALLPRPTPPIIAVTAYTTQEKLEEARAAGMTGFVTKPVTREKLERVIRGLSEGLRPKRSLDTHSAGALAGSPLASLGDLAPSAEQLSEGIAHKWQAVSALARLRDPRTGAEAHALRSLLLLATEEVAAEQVALLEQAADGADWPAVQRLLEFAGEEIAGSQTRLRA